MVAFGINPSRLRTHLDAIDHKSHNKAQYRPPLPLEVGMQLATLSRLVVLIHSSPRRHEVDCEYWRGTVALRAMGAN